MSTKAIRKALARLNVLAVERGSHVDDGPLVAAALDEARAIERAAKIHADREWMPDNPDWLWIRSLMKSIAKDAP